MRVSEQVECEKVLVGTIWGPFWDQTVKHGVFSIRKISIISAFLSSFIVSSNSLAYTATENQTAVEDYFKSSEEPKVLDALWTDKDIFKVGVRDDGSGRDGYAQYVCLILNKKGFKGKNVLVRVIDLPKLISTDEWVNLGTAFCR